MNSPREPSPQPLSRKAGEGLIVASGAVRAPRRLVSWPYLPLPACAGRGALLPAIGPTMTEGFTRIPYQSAITMGEGMLTPRGVSAWDGRAGGARLAI